MQAMIFAAGKGTRLKPLTDVIPKALVPVADMPLLQRVYLRLLDAGAHKVVVNVHHHARQLTGFIDLLRARYGRDILVSDESASLLETGGGVKKAQSLFSSAEPILIHNCDILSNVNLAQFYEQAMGADATLLVSERQTTRYLVFDDDMRLIGWKNVLTGEVKGRGDGHLYAFSGIHAISPTLFSLMNDKWSDRFPIMDFYLAHCAELNIRGILKPDLRLLDVGKLDTLASADEFLKGLNCQSTD